MPPPIAFEAEYSPQLIDQASRAFRDYVFKRYGWWLAGACVVNACGLAILLSLGAQFDFVLAPIVFIVILGPIWLLYKYFVTPARQAARLRRLLLPSVRASVNSGSLTLVVLNREITFPWSIVKAVVETPSLFLVVVSPFSFAFLPRSGLPSEVYATLRSKALRGAA
jgi:hypothetical protein